MSPTKQVFVECRDGLWLGGESPKERDKCSWVCLVAQRWSVPRASFPWGAERTSGWASNVGEFPAEAKICERPPSRLSQEAGSGPSGASHDWTNVIVFSWWGQWPEVCAGDPSVEAAW